MALFKHRRDIQQMREAARVAGMLCEALLTEAKPGMTTMALETLASRLLMTHKSTAPFKQFENFGFATCISINEEVVNGPPSEQRVLKDGDLVSLAIGTCIRGYHAKAARTRYLGDNPPEAVIRLIDGTQSAIDAAIKAAKQSPMLKHILSAIPATAETFGLTVVKDSGGFGIGKAQLEWPRIPNDPAEVQEDVEVAPGTVFALMPMMTLSPEGIWRLAEDGWTHVMEDGALAAHFADTMLMTESGLVAISRPQPAEA